MAEEKEKKGPAKKIAVAGVLGLISGIIAGVLLAPKAGKAIRKDLKKVSQKISKEVVKRAGEMKELTQGGYEELIDKISDAYQRAKEVKKEDLDEIIKELKSRWSDIAKKLKSK